ncbi:MAG: methyltransferase domain-containing protein, partial [Deltaproteobacteria bacterium]|nr:methyltransferase domain-containing protein [Deltaproteobacteria bacterium]
LGDILDAGSGTGALARHLGAMYPKARVVGMDIAEAMLNRAKEMRGCQGTRLVAGDIEYLPLRGSSMDIVASNLAYQWAEDVDRAFSETYRALKPGGYFVFSTLADTTLFELRETMKGCGDFPFIHFAGEDVLSDSLKKAGFADIRIEKGFKRKTYKDLFALLKTLKKVGAANPCAGGKKTLGRGAPLKEAAKIYAERYPAAGKGGIIATYEVIFVAARKGEHGTNR